MVVGDKVKFKEAVSNCPVNYVTNIPTKYLIHGSFPEDHTDCDAKIVGKYKKYFIVNFIDINDKRTQLGFRREMLISTFIW